MTIALYFHPYPLDAADRFRHWYQWVILGVALFSLSVPLLYYLVIYLSFEWQRFRARPTKIKVKKDGKVGKALQAVRTSPYYQSLPEATLIAASSYALCSSQKPILAGAPDLFAVPLEADLKALVGTESTLLLAYCDISGVFESERNEMSRLMESIDKRLSTGTSGFSGVVLSLSDSFSAASWMTLCDQLRSLNLLVFLELHPPYTDLVGINLGLVNGLIIRNATTLPTGLRRDFFRAFELRDVLGRCAKQKSTRPSFTTILHDPCELPSPPTLRRAFKFARFHEVLLSVCGLALAQCPQCLPLLEPLGAFDWLKRPDVLDFHRLWNEADVSAQPGASQIRLQALERELPGISAAFFASPTSRDSSRDPDVNLTPIDWSAALPSRASFFTTGEDGKLLSNRACYNVGEQITDLHVDSILRSQRHLRDLKLLHELTIYETQEILDYLSPLASFEKTPSVLDPKERAMVQSLIDLLKDGGLRVLRGLDSGFTLPENRLHMWSVAAEDDGVIYVYISLKALDLSSTLLHNFFLSKGVSRKRCYDIELAHAAPDESGMSVPPRLVTQLKESTYSELLSNIHQIRLCRDADCELLRGMVRYSRRLLLQGTTRAAWKKVHGEQFLGDTVTIKQLLQMRLNLLTDAGLAKVPSIVTLCRLYGKLERRTLSAIRNQDLEFINTLTKTLTDSYSANLPGVSLQSDLFGLMVLCVFRRLGVEETYIESSDRCPIYHFQKDQPGVFSELWVIGSQCEVYFDVTPGVLGAMHYVRYREYLKANPPPADAWNGIDVFTAYHKVENPTPEGVIPGDGEVGNPFKAKSAVFFPRIQKFAFLSVFCLPAVCDVMLLVFYGRGVIQSAFMTDEEILYGTYGLLTALLLCSGTIAWIGSSGGYYLFNAAFDSLTHMMIQRLSGAIALIVTVGVLGGFGIGAQQGWYPGLVFFLYIVVLGTYLNILGILATMHRDNSPLPSGRSVLGRTLPVLVLSPIITTFIHNHDFLIYIVVLYLFLALLYINFRKLCVEWSLFHTRVKLTDDQQVLVWYRETFEKDEQFDNYEVAREALEKAVGQARGFHFSLPLQSKLKSPNKLPEQLAPGLEYARWMLVRDLGPGAKAPAPFSSAWNNSIKVSLNTYQLFIRGLKEHSSFLQFRYAKNDIGYNTAMFIAVLLDRWVSITMSAAGTGPIQLYRFRDGRYCVSFGLAYFLMCAVALDYQLQFCWAAVVATSKRTITDTIHLDSEESRERSRKKSLYWHSLKDLLVIMLFVFGMWSLILLFWVDRPEDLETFFGYAGAYTCVLWFQFNRVFIKNGTTAFLLLATSVTIGYFTGVVLHVLPATYNFHFIDIIALGTCNLLAGVLSFLAADFGSARDEAEDDVHSPQGLMNKTGWKTHSQKFVGMNLSETEKLEASLTHLHVEQYRKGLVKVKKSKHGALMDQIEHLLDAAIPVDSVARAIPSWRCLLDQIKQRWMQGKTEVYLLSSGKSSYQSPEGLSAFGRLGVDGILKVYIPLPIVTNAWLSSHSASLAQLICEAMIHETCECVLQMSHADAVCAELILCSDSEDLLPSRIRQQITGRATELDAKTMVRRTNSEMLHNLCLGIRADVQWISLPEDLRRLIIARIESESHRPKIEATDAIGKFSRAAHAVPWRLYIERSNIKVELALAINRVCKDALEAHQLPIKGPEPVIHAFDRHAQYVASLSRGNDIFRRLFYGLYVFFQYIAVISNADTDVPRELIYSTRSSSFRWIGRLILLFIWRLCSILRRFMVEITLLHSRPELKEILGYCRNGIARTLTKETITVNDPFTPKTGFIVLGEANTSFVNVFPGIVTKAPEAIDKQLARAYYDAENKLVKLEQMAKGAVTKTWLYKYRAAEPLCRRCESDVFYYDAEGRISHGHYMIEENMWSFEYTFSHGQKTREMLKATYTCEDTSVSVFWCIPCHANANLSDVGNWAPTSKVAATIHCRDGFEWRTQYTYHHKRDPTIRCIQVGPGKTAQYIAKQPEWISKDANKFRVRPDVVHFDTDDLLYHHQRLTWWQQLRADLSLSRSSTVYTPMNTGALRSMLWNHWHKSKSLDGVTACYLDTQILRNEKLLRPYWTLKESGQFHKATEYLDTNIDHIVAEIELDDNISQNTFLPYKTADLYTMGTGGSANVKTRKYEDNYSDTADRLSIIFLDTGCFPDQPGGVSNCRRDLVNGHTTIRNHVFTESANDFGVPRYQIDRNIQSVKVLPLWGLDYLSPYHGLFDNLLDSQVRYREHHTSDTDIKLLFLPILRTLVKGARSQTFSQRDLAEYTQAFVDLSIYFEEKDYLKTWKSNLVKRTWRECWLQDMPNTVSTDTYFTLELPSMAQLDEAMELWTRYFFVFSVKIPDEVPKVFQCTHHGVGSLYGMLLKLRRGTTYMIWDHAIYFRESCLNVSSSQCILALSVQNMLLGVIALASHLSYTHADVILPCTNLFNPGWEADIGSDQGRRQQKIGFARKIDPVVNGISEMERFEPVDKIRSVNPTVMMLSNVQFIKDVKNAVLSADIIVNRFKFKKYRLVIYGALDRTPQYTSETEAIIKSRNLGENVKLAGFGNPKEILKDAWAFMNSSLSEGLPLAIGEAALSGCPVIATDVGATALVISDPNDPKIRYGEIVPPNDSVALARAQIQILAMLGPWVKYCDDNPPPMPEIFTEDDVNWITQRMYDKTEERRALGRKGRETVLHSFNGNRYLREHEQMYWLGSYRAQQRADPKLQEASRCLVKYGELLPIEPVILPRRSRLWDEDPWRYFEDKNGFVGNTKQAFRNGFAWTGRQFRWMRRNNMPDLEMNPVRTRRGMVISQPVHLKAFEASSSVGTSQGRFKVISERGLKDGDSSEMETPMSMSEVDVFDDHLKGVEGVDSDHK